MELLNNQIDCSSVYKPNKKREIKKLAKITKINYEKKNGKFNTYTLTLEDCMSSCQYICHPKPSEIRAVMNNVYDN